MKHQQQKAEGDVVEDRAQQPEDQHETADEADIPASGHSYHLRIDLVGGDGHLGEVGHEVGDQHLLREQRQEREKERGPGHAEHVAEVGTCGHENVLEGVGESTSPFAHSLFKNGQILLQENKVGGFLGHVGCRVDRQAHVGGVKRGGVN